MSIVSTTSLKLTEEIKQQATNAAKELGMTLESEDKWRFSKSH